MEKKELYPWQKRCLELWFENHCRGIVQAATGTGKTLFALTAARCLDQKCGQKLLVKIVVPTSALMRQWNQVLQEFFSSAEQPGSESQTGMREVEHGETASAARFRAGMRGGGFRSEGNYKYMIYVINSARYELARQILHDLRSGAPVLLIADECHRYESEQNRLIFEFLPHMKEYKNHFFSLGLTATLPSGQFCCFLQCVCL